MKDIRAFFGAVAQRGAGSAGGAADKAPAAAQQAPAPAAAAGAKSVKVEDATAFKPTVAAPAADAKKSKYFPGKAEEGEAEPQAAKLAKQPKSPAAAKGRAAAASPISPAAAPSSGRKRKPAAAAAAAATPALPSASSGGVGGSGRKSKAASKPKAQPKAAAGKRKAVSLVSDDGDDEDFEESRGSEEDLDDSDDVVLVPSSDDDDYDDLEDSDDGQPATKRSVKVKGKAKKTPVKNESQGTDRDKLKRGVRKAQPAKKQRLDDDDEYDDGGGSDEKELGDVEMVAAPVAPVAKASGRAVPASMRAPSNGPSSQAPPSQQAPAAPSSGRKATPASASRAKSSAGAAAGQGLDGSAVAAIAAVDAAVRALPAESDVKFSVMAEDGNAQGNDAAEPPNAGSKDMPRGHPDCLTGKTFVISGVLDSLMRPSAEDLIKRHGGKVTGSVSGRTSFLLVGENCGRSKMKTAKEKGTKIIDEDGLFSLINASIPHMPAAMCAPSATPSAAGSLAAAGAGAGGSQRAPSTTAVAGADSGVPRAAGSAAGSALAGAAARVSSVPRVPNAGANSDSQLWVDKYKPKSSRELVGNPGHIETLRSWLLTWENVHLRGAAPLTAKNGAGGKPKEMGKKAVLLSGPPGIGKTSAAHIVAKECGYSVVEMNASDTRNKSGKASEGVAGKLSNVIREMANNTTLNDAAGHKRKQLLVMDEVDGMSGGDRGGVQDLIQTIARTKIPIVCICNDKFSQKLKSLRNHCLELEWRKPTPQQASKRVLEICAAEGLQLNQSTCEALTAGAGGDMRLILGQLQMVRLRQAALSYDEVKGRLGTNKDMDMSPFECSRRLLESSSALMHFNERMEMVFADADLVPLLVQENYLNHKPTIASDMGQRLRAIAKAADAISMGDVVNNALRRTQNWSLMTSAAVIGTLQPCAYMRGMRETFGLYPGEMNFPRFTAWLGNNSTQGKQRRLLGELSTTLRASSHVVAPRGAVRLEYAAALRTLLTARLRREEEGGIAPTVQLMEEYCINREQFDYVLDVTTFKSKADWAADVYKDVPTKVKSAFTRAFNTANAHVAPKCGLQVEEVKLGRGKGKVKKKSAGDDDEEDADTSLASPGESKGANGDGEEADLDELNPVEAAKLARKLARSGVQLALKGDLAGATGTKGRKPSAGAKAGSASACVKGGARGGSKSKK